MLTTLKPGSTPANQSLEPSNEHPHTSRRRFAEFRRNGRWRQHRIKRDKIWRSALARLSFTPLRHFGLRFPLRYPLDTALPFLQTDDHRLIKIFPHFIPNYLDSVVCWFAIKKDNPENSCKLGSFLHL